jgi:hypothetical protein
MSNGQGKTTLPNWLWLYFPLLILILIILIFYFLSSTGGISKSFVYNRYHYNLADFLINSENGLVELGTVVILFPAIIYGICCIKLRKLIPNKLFLIWIILLTASSVYFAGEEISWGQQLFNWHTPDTFKEINDQHETNIHNISSWFDQKPRLALELWVVIGGIFAPVFFKLKEKKHDFNFWFWPPPIFIPTASIIVLLRLFDSLEWIDSTWFIYGIRAAEVQELYFAYFLMLYLLLSYSRLREHIK